MPDKGKFKTIVVAAAPIEPIRQSNIRLLDRVSGGVIPFGGNNLFPQEVAKFMRQAKYQRGISLDKAFHFAGTEFRSEDQAFQDWQASAGFGESFFNVHKKLVKDFRWIGNAYLHGTTDSKLSYLKLQHIDYTKCRVNKDHEVVINPDWLNRKQDLDQVIPIFPDAVEGEDCQYHFMIHIKDYEAEFSFYGIPDWITGFDNGKIDIRTDEWNLSHIEKGLKPDLFMKMPSSVTDKEIELVKKNLKEFKEGKPGSVLMVFGDGADVKAVNEKVMDLDWEKLNNQNLDKTLIANQWYKSLMSVSQATGFDTERVKYEYQLALGKIQQEQALFITLYKNLFNNFNLFNSEDLSIFNTPIIPEEAIEDRLNKMSAFFTEEQKAVIAADYMARVLKIE